MCARKIPLWARANQVKPVPVQFQIVMFAIVAAVLLFML